MAPPIGLGSARLGQTYFCPEVANGGGATVAANHDAYLHHPPLDADVVQRNVAMWRLAAPPPA